MTEKEALEICAELWGWLEKNPSERKRDWPGWEYRGGNIPMMSGSCPCCEYNLQQYGSGCSKCPLKDFWTRLNGDYQMCGDQFYIWNATNSPKTRKKYAKMIKDECLRRIK